MTKHSTSIFRAIPLAEMADSVRHPDRLLLAAGCAQQCRCRDLSSILHRRHFEFDRPSVAFMDSLNPKYVWFIRLEGLAACAVAYHNRLVVRHTAAELRHRLFWVWVFLVGHAVRASFWNGAACAARHTQLVDLCTH